MDSSCEIKSAKCAFTEASEVRRAACLARYFLTAKCVVYQFLPIFLDSILFFLHNKLKYSALYGVFLAASDTNIYSLSGLCFCIAISSSDTLSDLYFIVLQTKKPFAGFVIIIQDFCGQ